MPRTGYYVRVQNEFGRWVNVDIANLTDEQRDSWIAQNSHDTGWAIKWLHVALRSLREVWNVIDQENHTEDEE